MSAYLRFWLMTDFSCFSNSFLLLVLPPLLHLVFFFLWTLLLFRCVLFLLLSLLLACCSYVEVVAVTVVAVRNINNKKCHVTRRSQRFSFSFFGNSIYGGLKSDLSEIDVMILRFEKTKGQGPSQYCAVLH